MNQEKLALFLAVYRVELENTVRAEPGLYGRSLARVPALYEEIKDSFIRGFCAVDGAAFKNTCKAFGIPHSYQAISDFIGR